MKRLFLSFIVLLAFAGASTAGVIVDKQPDQGDWWFHLSGEASYVYANSFLSGPAAESVDVLGIYLLTDNPGNLVFQLLADSDNAPDPYHVLGSTAPVYWSSPWLDLVTGNLLSPVLLEPLTRYWIAGTTVGVSEAGSFTVGGHTQNSMPYEDGGTFWFSNDASGLSFDGQNFTPEMAIYAASGSEVPEPSSVFFLGSGLLAVFVLVRRKIS